MSAERQRSRLQNLKMVIETDKKQGNIDMNRVDEITKIIDEYINKLRENDEYKLKYKILFMVSIAYTDYDTYEDTIRVAANTYNTYRHYLEFLNIYKENHKVNDYIMEGVLKYYHVKESKCT